MIHSSTKKKIWNCKILQFSLPVTKTRKLLVQNSKIFSIRTEKQKCIVEREKKKEIEGERRMSNQICVDLLRSDVDLSRSISDLSRSIHLLRRKIYHLLRRSWFQCLVVINEPRSMEKDMITGGPLPWQTRWQKNVEKKTREEGKQKAERERKGLLGVVKKLWD